MLPFKFCRLNRAVYHEDCLERPQVQRTCQHGITRLRGPGAQALRNLTEARRKISQRRRGGNKQVIPGCDKKSGGKLSTKGHEAARMFVPFRVVSWIVPRPLLLLQLGIRMVRPER